MTLVPYPQGLYTPRLSLTSPGALLTGSIRVNAGVRTER